MQRHRATLCSVLVLALGLPALSGAGFVTGGAGAQTQAQQASSTLRTQAGEAVGTVAFTQEAGKVWVSVELTNLPPGFHGFHVHTNGVCDPATQFTSAGGHLTLAREEMQSGSPMGHAGDMTNLYVNADGSGALSFLLDRFTMTDLLAEGGRAVIVHAAPDNFMNLPSRYGVTPDQTTLDTGDAGTRIACGVVQ